MKKHLLTVVTSFTLIFGLFLGNAFAFSFTNYFPIKVGNEWSYNGDYTLTSSITGTSTINETLTYRLEQVFHNYYGPGADKLSFMHLTNDNNGFILHGVDDQDPPLDAPVTIIGANFEVGDVFNSTVSLGGGAETVGLTAHIVGFEDITVPAYSGQALKVIMNWDFTEEWWFASGIGLVKSTNTASQDFILAFNNQLLSVQPTNECLTNEDCSVDSYCQKSTGNCSEVGSCQLKPEACYDLYAPVCGCDGNTYSNDCYAASAGVSIASEGECAAPGSGLPWLLMLLLGD